MKEIKLKSQPKWMVRMFILVGAILGGVFAFISHPIGGTNAQSMDCPEGRFLATGNVCITDVKDIVIQATATGDGQTLTINKYFANAYTVDWGDGNPVENLTADTTHTYATAGTYTITLSLSGADRWTFTGVIKPLVPINGTTMSNVRIIYMPSLAEGFGDSATAPGDNFFYCFNGGVNVGGALTSLPEGSFDLSNIITAGDNFFFGFNGHGRLTSLPDGSFNTNNISIVGYRFFGSFNEGGLLKFLPEGSFRLATGLTTVGNKFFNDFNYIGSLVSLPIGSFNTENITTVGGNFFNEFNGNGMLTGLPTGSFNTSNITTVGNYFFSSFNSNGKLTSLPIGSFDTSNITTVGNYFFSSFNSNGKLTSLPIGSFDTSNITTVGIYFFSNFNQSGAITSLPEGSFDIENITTVETYFFNSFNKSGAITNLSESFKLTSAAYDKIGSYQNAFNSPNYTLNRNVSDLVSGVTAPNDDRNTFSDNQPGIKCGVHPNWLVNSDGVSCTITYDSNGGNTITDPTQQYVSNTTSVVAGNGITTPTKDGYAFRGWYTEAQTGSKITTVVFPDMDNRVLYAHWGEVQEYTITFDANGGTTSQSSQTLAENTSINLPNASMDGYEFLGWYTEFTGGMRVGGYNDSYIISQDVTLYAHWIQEYTVTFNTNGGTTNQTSQTLAENTSINLPNASMDGYEFLGWYTESSGGVRVGGYNDSYIISQDITLYAHWSEILPRGIFFSTGDITYTDTNGKVFSGIGTITIRSGDKTIIILDRNLGATTNDINDTGSYGYYFQWGNNHGFSLDDGFTMSNTAIEATGYSWNNPYVSGNFIAAKYWDISYNPELWGGAGDYDNDRGVDTSDDGYTRQGPCPAGYHVPSIGEFDELMRLTKSITGGTVQLQMSDNGNLVESNPFAKAFTTELHFPIAGYIGWNGVYTGILEEGYSYSHFWSSSFKKANGYLMINHHPTASKKDKVSTRGNNMQQGNAFSIRCFKDTADDGEEIVLSYETRDGSAIQAQTLPVGGTGYLPGYSTHREDAELLGWYEEDLLTQIDLENEVFDEDTTIYARWSDEYTVKFLDFDGSALKIEVVRSGNSANAPDNPARDGYTFNGWDLDFSNVTGDMVVTAQYSKNPSYSNGGGTQLKKDYCPWGDYSDSYYDGDCGTNPKDKEEDEDNGDNQHNSADDLVYDTLAFNPHYSDEMNKAYQYAYHYGITTKAPISNADIDGNVTRIAMAKMLSQYAINVLGIKPDTSRNNQFKDVPNELDAEYNNGVTIAYQLGIMGINMPNNEFRPNDLVPRSELVTALSRLLYNTSDGSFEDTSKYYIPHMEKLVYEGIITNPDPKMLELRGYVMLMLMRSDK